jgi:protein phosphatase
MINFLSTAQVLFASDSVSLQVAAPVVVIGDLHGQLLDLLRIIQTFGFPTHVAFLFLGDIVDRGEFSIETCTIVFALKIKYPGSVHIIRGNHEFGFLTQRCGFKEEIEATYGDSPLYGAFLSAFSMMALTAVISGKYLCVHGGLGPSWFSMGQASRIERPINDFGDQICDCMLWSDPSTDVDHFEPSIRGTGFLFGEEAVKEFLDTNNLKMVIRAHECVNTGCQFFFERMCVTVFSASNYGGLVSNNSAVLEIDEDGEERVRQFQPLQYLKRTAVLFGKVVNDAFVQEPSRSVHQRQKLEIPRLPPLSRGIPGNDQRVHSGKPGARRASWCDTPRTPLVRVQRKL